MFQIVLSIIITKWVYRRCVRNKWKIHTLYLSSYMYTYLLSGTIVVVLGIWCECWILNKCHICYKVKGCLVDWSRESVCWLNVCASSMSKCVRIDCLNDHHVCHVCVVWMSVCHCCTLTFVEKKCSTKNIYLKHNVIYNNSTLPDKKYYEHCYIHN